MRDDIAIEMMHADFILWRCLHGGPLTRDNLERYEANPDVDWPAMRARNLPLLSALTEAYGACAVTAREGDSVIGTLRFYPKAVITLAGSQGFCLQQPFPGGPAQDFKDTVFRPPEELEDRTLTVHCLAAGQPGARDDTHRRKGLGTRMVRTLIDWARPRGWRAIETATYADLDILYTISGSAGRTFWERLGFHIARTDIEPELLKEGEIIQAIRQEAAARGISPEQVADKYTMRLDLA